jgi:hypothetical protein
MPRSGMHISTPVDRRRAIISAEIAAGQQVYRSRRTALISPVRDPGEDQQPIDRVDLGTHAIDDGPSVVNAVIT